MKPLSKILSALLPAYPKILFITALRLESAVLQQQIPFLAKEKVSGALTWRGRHQPLLLIQLGMGAYGKEKLLTRIFQEEKPDLIVNYGIAGALKKMTETSASFGITHILDKNYRALQWLNPLPESARAISLFSAAAPVLSAELRDEIAKKSGCELVDMEAAVLAKLCAQLNIPFICIKTVSDFADQQTVEMVKQGKEMLQQKMTRALAEYLSFPDSLQNAK